MYPITRLRRNRRYKWLRELVAETSLLPANLILPIFVIEGRNLKIPIATMPEVEKLSIDLALKKAKLAARYGIRAVAIFPVIEPKLKTIDGKEALNSDNLICRTIKLFKEDNLPIGIIADVALDPYTTHGHDGLLNENKDDVDNDKTLLLLCEQAKILAAAGADIIAPSDMMDGRIKAIRSVLDDNKYYNTIILSYAAKYASNFYGPFRDAVGSKISFGQSSKKTYQMDYRNVKEALNEVDMDIQEGADMVMVKPASMYLDIISAIASKFNISVFGYQTSGEYSMIKYASLANCMDFNSAMLESLLSIKRAGAIAIFTYAAIEVAKYLKEIC